ncbi:hypothetical protein PS706_03313 [Pseudomonas fluorescens]|nr:hypothetical protein PS706_03313 [Pseudomonas fluorescens]
MKFPDWPYSTTVIPPTTNREAPSAFRLSALKVMPANPAVADCPAPTTSIPWVLRSITATVPPYPPDAAPKRPMPWNEKASAPSPGRRASFKVFASASSIGRGTPNLAASALANWA